MKRRGFTLIELVIVITLMVILFGVYFLASNPGKQLAAARNTQRKFDIEAIMNAVQQNVADSTDGKLVCAAGAIPTSSARMTSAVAATGTYNIAPCLVPTYIAALPFDPSASSSHYNSVSDYDTGFNIIINASGSITLSAPFAELSSTIRYP